MINMKKYLFSSVWLVALIFLLVMVRRVYLPRPPAVVRMILVVVDHALWERPAGRALYDVLDTDVPGLPQSEHFF